MKKTIFLVLALALLLGGCTLPGGLSGDKNKPVVITPEEAKTKTADFINKNLMQPGNTVTVKDAVEEDGLYKLTVVMSNGQEISSYMTKDGKKFFAQAMELEQYEKQATDTATQDAAKAQTPADVPKADKAKVELFVMSHCPYGTQIEKGILPVIEKLGNKMDFELKFCDYAMHGEKEVKEQLNQYCIQKNEPKKLVAYLNCFLSDSNGAACLTSAGINKANLDKCVSETDKQYKVMASFADKSTWISGNYPPFDVYKSDNTKYGIKGSPGLVINGKQVSSARDANSLLKAVCAGFTTEPEECKAALSSDTPAPGFGTGTAASGSAAAGCAN